MRFIVFVSIMLLGQLVLGVYPPSTIAANQKDTNDPSFEYAGTYGGVIGAVRNVGAYSYIGQGSMLRVFKNDRSAADNPQEIAHFRMDGVVTYIDSYGPALYVLAKKRGVKNDKWIVGIYNIRDPLKIKLVKPDYRPFGDPLGDYYITIEGKKLISWEESGFPYAVLDLNNPFKPVRILIGTEAEAHKQEFNPSPKKNDVFTGNICQWKVNQVLIRKNIAFLLSDNGIQLVDVASPGSPHFLSQMSLDTTVTALDCSEEYLAVSSKFGVAYLYAFDKTEKPNLIKRIPIDMNIGENVEGYPVVTKAIQVQDHYLSVIIGGDYEEETNQVKVYDILSSSTQPAAIIKSDTPCNRLYETGFAKLLKYRLLNNNYWVDAGNRDGDMTSAISIRDLKARSAKEAIAQYPQEEAFAFFSDDPVVSHCRIFVYSLCQISDRSEASTNMYDFTSGSIHPLASVTLPEGGYNHFVQGDVLYSPSGSGGLVMYRIHY